MICFRVSCYNLDGCKWCKLILLLHMSIWTNRSFHTDLQTQLSRGTAELSLNSWDWDLICWSLPAFSPLCVLWARVCACLSDLCVSDPTRPFFHLMALSHLRILIYSQTLWGSLKLSFLFCGSHTDCGWKIRPVCSDFLSLSVFLFLQGGQGGNHRRQCKTSLLQWPCDLLGENRNTHTSNPVLHLNSLVLLA